MRHLYGIKYGVQEMVAHGSINRLSFVTAVNCKKSICQIEIVLIRAQITGRYLAGMGTGPSTLTR